METDNLIYTGCKICLFKGVICTDRGIPGEPGAKGQIGLPGRKGAKGEKGKLAFFNNLNMKPLPDMSDLNVREVYGSLEDEAHQSAELHGLLALGLLSQQSPVSAELLSTVKGD